MEKKNQANDIAATKEQLGVGHSIIGWHALWHIEENYWLGTDAGVNCYKDHELARMALTIVTEMRGDKGIEFCIKEFTGADRNTGDVEMAMDGESAIRNIGNGKAKLPRLPIGRKRKKKK